MSTLRLRIREDCEEPYVEFHVNGEDLGSRIKAALGDAGFDHVLPWNGGDYKIDETVLGKPARQNGCEAAILFACGCGYYACSGVSADVVVSETTLTLQNFSTRRGGQRVVAGIEPIAFDRQQFESAVAELHRDVADWRPPPRSEVPRTVLVTPPPARPDGDS